MYGYNDVSGVIVAILVIFILFNLAILFLIIALLRAILNTSRQTERTAYFTQMILQQIAPQAVAVQPSRSTEEPVGQGQPSQNVVDVLNAVRHVPGKRLEVWQQCQQIPIGDFDRAIADLLIRKWIMQDSDDTYHAVV